MKKILIASCLVLVLGAGCNKPAPQAEATPTAKTSAPDAPPTPAATAGQTAQPAPSKEHCELLQKEYLPIQHDRLRVVLGYKVKMLDIYKKVGKVTPEANVEVGKLAQEMQSELDEVLTKHGLQSTAEMNPQGCAGFQPAGQDRKVVAEFDEMVKKMAQIDKEIMGFTSPESQPASAPASATNP